MLRIILTAAIFGSMAVAMFGCHAEAGIGETQTFLSVPR